MRHETNTRELGLNAVCPRLSSDFLYSNYKEVGSISHWVFEKYAFTQNSTAFDSLSYLSLTNLAFNSIFKTLHVQIIAEGI